MLDPQGNPLVEKPDSAIADSRQIEDSGEVNIRYIDGPHAGHIARYKTAKYNCGAYSTVIECQCDHIYASAMNGCWQQGHQRHESGDLELLPSFPY